jgi:hypothetical protein
LLSKIKSTNKNSQLLTTKIIIWRHLNQCSIRNQIVLEFYLNKSSS